MALSILSLGMLTPLPLSTARRRRGLKPTSPPPILAATVISLAILENVAPRFSSWRPLRCWIFAHLECPAILTSCVECHCAAHSCLVPKPKSTLQIVDNKAAHSTTSGQILFRRSFFGKPLTASRNVG